MKFDSQSNMMLAIWACPLLRKMRIDSMLSAGQKGMDKKRDDFLSSEPICSGCGEPIWHMSRCGLCDKCRNKKNLRRFRANHPHYYRDYNRNNGHRRAKLDSEKQSIFDIFHSPFKRTLKKG